ncbi:glutaredoxin family protein [Ornithinimicrobium sp. Y1694]|uniref:glutaredoxin family protein n=1 Tax=Ornithinimicrobium sp. Y1694 TaxID=3418590 RepID=UPI003CF2D4EC
MRWWRRAREGAPQRSVVIWSRAGCHLCEQMESVVRDVAEGSAGRRGPGRARPPVAIEVRDLDEAGREDPALLAELTTLVPVLEVDGRRVAHWQVDAQTVRAALLD